MKYGLLDDGKFILISSTGYVMNTKRVTRHELYLARMVVEDMEDGTYFVHKDRNGRPGRLITEDELFLEVL